MLDCIASTRRTLFAGLLGLSLIGLLAGCHTDLLSNRTFECASNDDCVGDYRCDIQQGVCVKEGSVVISTDAGSDAEDGGQDTGPSGDDAGRGQCTQDEDCPQSGAMCILRRCIPPCQSQGQHCATRHRDQGGFLCVGEAAVGVCQAKCDTSRPIASCSQGSFCIGPPDSCHSSQCDSNADCDSSKKCLHISPNVGFCVDRGTGQVGDTCDTFGDCTDGAWCTGWGDGSLRCSRDCSLWSEGECADEGLACVRVTFTQSACVGRLDMTSKAPLASCGGSAAGGEVCGDHARCSALPLGVDCETYCLDNSDCSGLTSPKNNNIECVNDVLDANNGVGICLEACNTDADCGTNMACQSGHCLPLT